MSHAKTRKHVSEKNKRLSIPLARTTLIKLGASSVVNKNAIL